MKFDKTLQGDCKISLCAPSAKDVLCGRGAPINKHPGNIMFRKLVKYNKQLYNVCEKDHRYHLAKSIVLALEEQNPPTRFLEQNSDGNGNLTWTTISKERAIRKTFQALREKTTSSRDTPQQSNSTILGSSEKENSVYSEEIVAWQHLLQHMTPGSLNLSLASVSRTEYNIDSNESLDGNERKSILERKIPRTERYSPILNLLDKVSSSNHQQLIQPKLSDIRESPVQKMEKSEHLKANSETSETITSYSTNKIEPERTISLDQSRDLEAQSIYNKTNDKKSHSLTVSATDFHVNIDPVKTSGSSVKELPELSTEIGYELLNESSHEILDQNQIKQEEVCVNKESPLDDMLISGDNTDFDKWFDFGSADLKNTSLQIEEDTHEMFHYFIGGLICT